MCALFDAFLFQFIQMQQVGFNQLLVSFVYKIFLNAVRHEPRVHKNNRRITSLQVTCASRTSELREPLCCATSVYVLCCVLMYHDI